METKPTNLLDDLEFVINKYSMTPRFYEAKMRVVRALDAYEIMLKALYQCRAHFPTERPPLLEEAIAAAEGK